MEKVLDFDLKWDYNNPEKTEDEFKNMLEASSSKELNYRGQLLTQIARTHSLRGQFDAAHQILDGLEILLKTNDLPVVSIRYALERGRTYNSAGEKVTATHLVQGCIRSSSQGLG